MKKIKIPMYFTPDGIDWFRINSKKLEEFTILDKKNYTIFKIK